MRGSGSSGADRPLLPFQPLWSLNLDSEGPVVVPFSREALPSRLTFRHPMVLSTLLS